MSRLLLYNPENDLALASGLERFTPPSAGRLMVEAGALLPLWWAREGDELIADPSLADAAARLCDRFGLHGSVGYRCASGAAPWGWSASARRRYLDAGFPAAELPDDDALGRMRSLSHRRSSIAVHRMIGTPPELVPVEATDAGAAVDACRRFGRAVVKQPWSCSGRGVFFSRTLGEAELRRRIEGCIRRQGSVVVEPEYDRTAEMAALFYAAAGRVSYRGMSVFSSDTRGSYVGNVVAPQAVLEEKCGADAVAAAHALERPLTALVGADYTGWLGVDMLRHAAGLNPCMEINLRMTMGVVALYLARRLPAGRVTTVAGSCPPDAVNLSPTGAAMSVVFRQSDVSDC